MTYQRTFTIIGTVAELRATPGPELQRFWWIRELNAPYRWVPESGATHDGWAVITSLVGGFTGAWIRMRADDAGDPLGDANATITVAGGLWRTLPVATLTAPRVLVLDPTNAASGDPIEITRLDTTAYTYRIDNGGPGGGTLFTLPAGSRSFAVAQLVGTNFAPRRSGLML